MKYYTALVISKAPFSLPEELSRDQNIKHLITTEFEMGKEINFAPGHDSGCIADKSAPEYCNDSNQLFRGSGSSISGAILDWLRNLCKSSAYRPFYFKFDRRE